MAGNNRYGAGDHDYWILKFDSSGNVAWEKTYGGIYNDEAYSIQQTTDGGYIVAGRSRSFKPLNFPADDIWILKLDSNGDINNADFIGTSNAGIGSDINWPGTVINSISTPSLIITDTSVTPQNTEALVQEQAFAPDWFPMEVPSQDKLNGVWGYRSDQTHKFYAVGENGTIIHFNGEAWTTTGSPTGEDLYGIWGNSGTDIFAVGDNGTIVRYNGIWIDMTPGLGTVNLKDVWGSSGNDVYAVGEGGFIAHYDGSTWSQVSHSLTSETLNGIWGNASNNYVVVGAEGTVLRYNGSWSKVTPSPTLEDLSEVWGVPPITSMPWVKAAPSSITVTLGGVL